MSAPMPAKLQPTLDTLCAAPTASSPSVEAARAEPTPGSAAEPTNPLLDHVAHSGRAVPK